MVTKQNFGTETGFIVDSEQPLSFSGGAPLLNVGTIAVKPPGKQDKLHINGLQIDKPEIV